MTTERNKTAVITGAADGIGKALVAYCLQAGYRVIGIDIDAERAAAVQAEGGADVTFIIADLSQTPDMLRVASELSAYAPLDLVIQNAGINAVGHFQHSDLTRQQTVIDVNLLAPLILTQQLLAANAINLDGSLVFISSLSRYVSYPGASVYAATKDGIASYARSLALGLPNTHVMTVYPGPTRTAHARRYSPDNSRENKRMLPEDLAAIILRGIEKRQRVVIPGAANWVFAFLGRYLSPATDSIMRKSLLEKFDTP